MSNHPHFLVADIVIHTLQPVTYTHHGIADLPLMVRGVDAEGQPQRTVFLPASQIRGRIRHEAALAAMRARSEKVSLEEAYMMALGQDLRPEEGDAPEEIRLRELQQRRKSDPFLDLFGTWKMSSRLYVSHLLPERNVLPDRMRHIRRDLDTNIDIMGELDDPQQDALYERQARQADASKAGTQIKLATAELRKAKKANNSAEVDRLEALLTRLEELKKTHKGDDDSDNTKHLVEVSVIPAGIDMLGKLTVQHPLPSDLMTLLTALDGISRNPYVGAQRARGCGEVRGSARFRTAAGDVYATLAFGGMQPARVQWTEAGQTFAGIGAPQESAIA